MKRIFPKSKLGFVNLVILLIILGGIILVESGPEPWLDSEKVFDARLYNSLGSLDGAKSAMGDRKAQVRGRRPNLGRFGTVFRRMEKHY
jgi:hypothetical protein